MCVHACVPMCVLTTSGSFLGVSLERRVFFDAVQLKNKTTSPFHNIKGVQKKGVGGSRGVVSYRGYWLYSGHHEIASLLGSQGLGI